MLKMLAKLGILTDEERDQIIAGLKVSFRVRMEHLRSQRNMKIFTAL